MTNNTTLFLISLLPFLTAFFATALLTYITIPLAKKWGLIDDPKKHKHPGIIHTKPVPRAGGIPLFLGAFLTAMLFIPMTSKLAAIFIAAFIALVIGVLDDKKNAQAKDVSPYLRFAVVIGTAIIVVASGISINFITNPFSGGILHLDAYGLSFPFFPFHILLSQVVSVLWLVWVMNMTNWSKGVDGQMPGIVGIAALTIGILSLKLNPIGAGGFVDAQLSFIIAGCALGFLIFNFYPAKIFPGWSATALYLLLGVASILTSAKLATAILVLGVPMVDAFFIIVRRIGDKKSPFQGDKKHLHHLLLKLGYNQKQVALFYWSFSAILGLLSLTLESKSKLFAIVMLSAVTGGVILFLHRLSKTRNEKLNS